MKVLSQSGVQIMGKMRTVSMRGRKLRLSRKSRSHVNSQKKFQEMDVTTNTSWQYL